MNLPGREGDWVSDRMGKEHRRTHLDTEGAARHGEFDGQVNACHDGARGWLYDAIAVTECRLGRDGGWDISLRASISVLRLNSTLYSISATSVERHLVCVVEDRRAHDGRKQWGSRLRLLLGHSF
jgi:hypothetical protein